MGSNNLLLKDCAVLLRGTAEGVIHTDESSDSFEKLKEAELVDDSGKFTTKGDKFAKELSQKRDQLREGLPISRRQKTNDTDPIFNDEGRPAWLKATVQKTPVITNGEVFLVGAIAEKSDFEKGGSAFSSKLKGALRPCLTDNEYAEITAKAWQMDDLDGREIIWLGDDSNNVRVAISAEYYDLLTKQYPNAKWFGKGEMDMVLLQSNRNGYGLENQIAAGVMPLDLRGVSSTVDYIPYLPLPDMMRTEDEKRLEADHEDEKAMRQ